MSSNTLEPGWQRLLGWMNRRWRKSGEPVSAGESNLAEVREPCNAEQVDAWEDEGGAPAGHAAAGDRSAPVSPADPTH